MGNNTSTKKLPGTLTGDTYMYQEKVRIGDIIRYSKRLYLVLDSRGHNLIGIIALTPELLASHFPPIANSDWTELSFSFPPVFNPSSAYASNCQLAGPCLTKTSWNERHMELCKYYDALFSKL